jgi:hypothetical protein
MGLIRGGAVVIVSILLLVSFLITASILTLSSSLKYENIKDGLSPIIKETIEQELGGGLPIENNLSMIEQYCKNNSEFIFSESGYVITIPCETAKQGSDAIIEKGINDMINESYYKNYDCSFFDCLQKPGAPFSLVSQGAYEYWKSKFYLALILSIILIVALFLLVENKSNAFILSGALLIVSSLPLFGLKNIAGFFVDKSILKFLSVFFAQASLVFYKALIAGIVLISIGIGIKFAGVGMKITNFFNKSKKDNKAVVIQKKSK